MSETQDRSVCWYLPETVSGRRAPAAPNVIDLDLVRRTVAALDAAAPVLEALPVATIVAAIDRTIARWLNPDDRYRQRILAEGPAITGYSRAALEYALDVMLPRFRADGLWSLLHAEVGDPEALDRFVPFPEGIQRMARGRGRQFQVLAGSVPTVPIFGMICALLVKSPVLVKPPSHDPLFPALFAATLAAVEPGLADAIAVLPWAGGCEELEQIALDGCGVVVAYGADATLADLRRRTPTGARFVGYGNRISLAAVGRAALAVDAVQDSARRLAWDVALFDQHGCLSPQFALVEQDGAVPPREFASLVAGELASLAERLPRGPIDPQAAARIQALRAAFAFRTGAAAAISCSRGSTEWTVLCTDHLDPAWLLGDRTLAVVAVDDLARDLRRVAGHLPISTVGTTGTEQRCGLAAAFARVALRICPLGSMGEPPVTWRHDGQPNLTPLLDWVDREPSAGAQPSI
jgi:hypothetical protein